MSQPPRPKITKPDPIDDSAEKSRAAYQERRINASQRGHASSVFAGENPNVFGSGRSAGAMLKSSLG